MKIRKKELGGAESKRREKKESKKLSRELQEAPEEAPSHDPSALSSDYELSRSYEGHRGTFDGPATELRRSCDGAAGDLIFAVDVVP